MLDSKDISFHEEEILKPDFKEGFKNSWPTVEPVLEGMRNLIKNPIAKAIITLVIGIGNIIYGKVSES